MHALTYVVSCLNKKLFPYYDVISLSRSQYPWLPDDKREKNKTLSGQRTKTQGRSGGWGGKEEKVILKFAALLPVHPRGWVGKRHTVWEFGENQSP